MLTRTKHICNGGTACAVFAALTRSRGRRNQQFLTQACSHWATLAQTARRTHRLAPSRYTTTAHATKMRVMGALWLIHAALDRAGGGRSPSDPKEKRWIVCFFGFCLVGEAQVWGRNGSGLHV